MAEMKFALACLLIGTFTLQALMQDEQTLKLRAEARLVEIIVTVRDAQGKPIKGLRKNDFTLSDNNKPREFSIFNTNDFDSPTAPTTPEPQPKSTPLPPLPPNTFTNTRITTPPPDAHSTIILLDGMNGWFESFVWGAQGIEGLMSKLPPDERIAVYVDSHYVGLELLQDYTTDRAKLLHAVSTFLPKGMEPGPAGMDGSDGRGMTDPPEPRLPLRATQEEAEYELRQSSESVRLSLQALADKLRNLPGRKSVFWVTEGFPPRQLRGMGQAGWDKTISTLNDANVEVNTIDTDGLGGPRRRWGPGAILSMQQIAEETGGQAFFHTNDLAGAMAKGIADTRSSYTLAFYLSEVDGKYHDLKVKVDRPNAQLSYRQGYFARSEADADLSARKSDLVAMLTNPVDATGIGITATIAVTPGTPRGTFDARVKLDPDALTVTRVRNQWNCKLEEVFLEFNAEGAALAKFSIDKTLSITDANKQAFDAHGTALSQSLPLVPGTVRIAIAVRDSASGHTGSISIPISEPRR